MNETRNNASAAVIVGLGVTGLSCARYLLRHGWRVCVTDSREDPPGVKRCGNWRPISPCALVVWIPVCWTMRCASSPLRVCR